MNHISSHNVDKFCYNLINAFQEMWLKEYLVDISLVCEGKILKAHKVFLSAASEVFKSIIESNPCKHPVVVLQDIEYEDLLAVIKFVYMGEVSCLENKLPSVLRIAKTLQIQGLLEGNFEYITNTKSIHTETKKFEDTEKIDVDTYDIASCKPTMKANTLPSHTKQNGSQKQDAINDPVESLSSIDLTESNLNYNSNMQIISEGHSNELIPIVMPKIVSSESLSHSRKSAKQRSTDEMYCDTSVSKKRCLRIGQSSDVSLSIPIFKIISTRSVVDNIEAEDIAAVPSTSKTPTRTSESDSIVIDDKSEDTLRPYRDYLNKRSSGDISDPLDCEESLEAETDTKFDCPFCFDHSTDLDIFHYHIFLKHVKNNCFTCKLCKKYFFDKLIWFRHVRKIHDMDDKESAKVLKLIKDVLSLQQTNTFRKKMEVVLNTVDDFVAEDTDDSIDTIEIL